MKKISSFLHRRMICTTGTVLHAALPALRRNAFKVGVTTPLLAVAFFSCLLSARAAAPAGESGVDFPLALRTKWTDHLHEEVGEGVHFQGILQKFDKGNTLDATVSTEVVGSDLINGETYIRLESRIADTPWLTQWLRQTAGGLLLGKTIDFEQGEDVTLMVPPQKLLSPALKAGESWDWRTTDAATVMHIKVVGPADITVPAGTFPTTQLSYDVTVQAEIGLITVRQRRWFAPGVGYAKQDTEIRLGEHLLSHVVLTLEKYEPAQGAQLVKGSGR
jgi:hypothetical protein